MDVHGVPFSSFTKSEEIPCPRHNRNEIYLQTNQTKYPPVNQQNSHIVTPSLREVSFKIFPKSKVIAKCYIIIVCQIKLDLYIFILVLLMFKMLANIKRFTLT